MRNCGKIGAENVSLGFLWGRDGDNNVKHMREQVRWAMVKSAREVYGSVRIEGKNPKSMWWSDEVKAVVRRKEAAWKEVLPLAMKRQK